MKDTTQLLVKAAQLYYEENVSQIDLAGILGISRPTVSRLLKKAQDEGIVEIIVHDPISKEHELSSKLRTRLGLRDAVVITGNYPYSKSIERCCEAAVQFLDVIMSNGCTIGIAWGIVPQIINRILPPLQYSDISVVQMVGCLGTNIPDADGLRLAIEMAQTLNAKCYSIYSPIYVHNKAVRDYLCNEPGIRDALEISSHADILINGVGNFDMSSAVYNAGYWTAEGLDRHIDAGAVGHLLGRAYDISGAPVDIEDTYIVGAPLEAMRNAEWSIAVSASEKKAKAVLGAIRGGYINVLIADTALAHKLLELTEND